MGQWAQNEGSAVAITVPDLNHAENECFEHGPEEILFGIMVSKIFPN